MHSLERGQNSRRTTGHESQDVTLAYLKGRDAESEETQEHANSSSRLALLNLRAVAPRSSFSCFVAVDVTLAYLKGKDAESEEAQEHANNSSLALYA